LCGIFCTEFAGFIWWLQPTVFTVNAYNWTATADVPRERVVENRGNAQIEYLSRGFPRL
jgi:hypothetical protein